MLNIHLDYAQEKTAALGRRLDELQAAVTREDAADAYALLEEVATLGDLVRIEAEKQLRFLHRYHPNTDPGGPYPQCCDWHRERNTDRHDGRRNKDHS